MPTCGAISAVFPSDGTAGRTVAPRALITGLRGFTGRYLAAELQAHGWEIWGMGSEPGGEDQRYACVDLLDAEGVRNAVALARPDVVAHLAGVAFVGHGNADAFYRVNLIGTRNLLAALAEAPKKPDCVLLASSANIYGNATGGMLDETTPANPANDYGVSKLAMEYMARLWMDKLPIVITRPFNYTGVGQSTDFLVPKIVSHFRQRARVIELGNLDVSRDFSDVRSVVRAYRLLLQARPAGAVVNVCSGRAHSLREVLDLAQRLSGHSIQVQANPKFMRGNEVATLCGNPGKLLGIIGGWQSVALQETLQWMLTAEAAPHGGR